MKENLFSNLIKLLALPKIPVHLNEQFLLEYNKSRSVYIDFLVKYIGWILFLLFWTVDVHFNPSSSYASLTIRLLVFPVSVAVYIANRSSKLAKYVPIFTAVSVSLMMNVIVVLISKGKQEIVLMYIPGLYLSLIVLHAFLQPSAREVLIYMFIIFSPLIGYCIFIKMDSFLVYYFFTVGFSIGFVLLIHSIVRTKSNILEFMNKQQSLVDAQIGENIAQISHDTRAPLMALRAIDGGYFPPDKVAGILKMSVTRLIELVDGITQSASQLYLNKYNHDLELFCNECCEYISFLHPERKILWAINLTKKQYPMDKNKVKRVIINLVNNAIKASEETENAVVEISIDCKEKFIVTVHDNGPGFKDEKAIFEKGFSEHGSSGLGLAFCKTVIEEHGGYLKAHSGQNRTVFTFCF